MGPVLDWLVAFFIACGTIVVAFLTPLGKKLFDYLLQRRISTMQHEHSREIEALRHDQNQKIEQLKAQLATLADRGRHANEREFAALTLIWEQLIGAHLATARATGGLLRIPDLDRLSDDDLESFLNSTDFSEDQKRTVRKAVDKNRAYSRNATFKLLAAAQNTIFDARLIFRKQRIFVPSEIQERVMALLDMMSEANTERLIAFENMNSGIGREKTITFSKQGEAALSELAELVRKRLVKD